MALVRSSGSDWKERIYESVIVRSWWMILFLGLCFLFYTQGMQKKQNIYSELKARKESLEREKYLAQILKEDLLLQINSQSDPAWIQMTLMKGLGVVPEGQIKVYFKKDE